MKRVFFVIILSLFLSPYIFVYAAGAPSIFSYQARLADSRGDLLGGSGTTYYFKFSIWDNANIGSGRRLWPSFAPGATMVTVRNGFFSVNIGDTANGYPDDLDYDFSINENIYLQVEVSSNNIVFETVSPRQRIASVIFAQIAEAIVFDNGFKLKQLNATAVIMYDSAGIPIFEFDEGR